MGDAGGTKQDDAPKCRSGADPNRIVRVVAEAETAFGYVLHNLATGEDISTETEAEALARTRGFTDEHDWSLWKVRRDGTGEPTMIAVGSGPVETELDDWFAARGFRICPSETDYSDEVQRSPWGRKAPSRNRHVWVDLCAMDSRVVQRGYGSGDTLNEARRRAQDRYRVEQEGGPPPGPRVLP